ncbi:MAG: AraC family transcriptional regulator ligand-binding domain-containing protein [Candidatus Binatia bacterium]
MRKWTDTLPMPSAYFQLALRELGGTPEREAALREGTGIASDDPSAEITLGQQLRQIRNINHLHPPGWALGIGTLFDASTHGPVGFAAVSAPTLADSLVVVARFGHVRVPYYRLESHRDTHHLTLALRERTELTDEERVPLLEMLMLSVQSLVERVLGRPMSEAVIHFAYPRPLYADRYAAHFHAKVRFDAVETTVVIPARWLTLKSPLADPVMYETSIRKLEALDRGLEADDYIVTRVEHLVASSRDSGPSLETAAKRLHVSSRTLVRRLQRAGTTYSELLDAQRRERAEALLRDRNLGIADVSNCLGYGDPANFGRACRRWFGMAPRQYRKRLLSS